MRKNERFGDERVRNCRFARAFRTAKNENALTVENGQQREKLTFERIPDESHAHIRVSASQCSSWYVLRFFDDSARLNGSTAVARIATPFRSSSSVICDVSRYSGDTWLYASSLSFLRWIVRRVMTTRRRYEVAMIVDDSFNVEEHRDDTK